MNIVAPQWETEMSGDKMIDVIWVLGMPDEYREHFSACMSGFEVKFTTVKMRLSDQLFRIRTDGTHLIALWPGTRAPDHDEFVATYAVPVAVIDAIKFNMYGTKSMYPGLNIGFRLRNIDTAENLQLRANISDPVEQAALLNSYINNVDGAARALPDPMTLPGSAFLVLSAPGMATAEARADYALNYVETFAAHYPGKPFVLFCNDFTLPETFETALAQDMFTIVSNEFDLGWLHATQHLVTDDRQLAIQAKLRHVPVEMIDDNGVLVPPAFEQQDPVALFLAEYVNGSFYASPLDLTPLTFDDALRFQFDHEPQLLFSMPIANPPKLPNGTFAFAANWLSPQSRVTIFDDRSKGGMLTCILPYRFSADRPDSFERLRYAEADRQKPDNIEILVVDDGSEEEAAALTRALCAEMGYSYAYVDTSLEIFSVGRCRNVGAQYASTNFIMMQDIDLIPYTGFYSDLLREIQVQGMLTDAKHFLMVPYIFLTRNGTELFRRMDEQTRRQAFIHAAIVGDETLVEKFSTGTSANVYNRHWYLSRGGNDETFEGWGYEDLECNTRMIRHLKYFPLPRNWATEKFNFNSVSEFSTYKSVYRLFGDMMMMKGIAFFHAWHPVGTKSDYIDKQSDNRQHFIKKVESFPKTNAEPAPLPDMSRGVSLMFRRNAFTYCRLLAPSLGKVLFMPDETVLVSKGALERFVAEHQVRRIVFFNPYQTEHMQLIYGWARELGIEYVVAERGALPRSSFLDTNGFLYDSATYHPDNWDKPLPAPKAKAVEEYIVDIRSSRPSLEDQPAPIGGRALRAKLGIPDTDKVIFVPLQRPGDTVTRFFNRDVSYLEFVEQVRALCQHIYPNIRILIKTHPLEEPALSWGSGLIVDDDNVYDLIEASDLIWTFNSGVGVLGLLWGRSVALSGAAFYGVEGLNHYVDGPEDVLKILDLDFIPDPFKTARFVSLLIHDLYSFGDHMTKKVKMPDGSNMTATTDILYDTLRVNDQTHRFSYRSKPSCTWSSILFDRYRFAEQKKTTPA